MRVRFRHAGPSSAPCFDQPTASGAVIYFSCHTFPGGEEALRCWTAYVDVLDLPKWGRIKRLWLR